MIVCVILRSSPAARISLAAVCLHPCNAIGSRLAASQASMARRLSVDGMNVPAPV
jgi:hypothetical protein